MKNTPLAQVDKAQTAINFDKPSMVGSILLQPFVLMRNQPEAPAAGVTAPKPAQPPVPPPIAIKRFAVTPSVTDPAPSYPIPIAHEADGTVTPYLTNAQLYDILNEQDLAQYQRVLSGASGQ